LNIEKRPTGDNWGARLKKRGKQPGSFTGLNGKGGKGGLGKRKGKVVEAGVPGEDDQMRRNNLQKKAISNTTSKIERETTGWGGGQEKGGVNTKTIYQKGRTMISGFSTKKGGDQLVNTVKGGRKIYGNGTDRKKDMRAERRC